MSERDARCKVLLRREHVDQLVALAKGSKGPMPAKLRKRLIASLAGNGPLAGKDLIQTGRFIPVPANVGDLELLLGCDEKLNAERRHAAAVLASTTLAAWKRADQAREMNAAADIPARKEARPAQGVRSVVSGGLGERSRRRH